MSEMNVQEVLTNLEKQTFLKQDGWNYCELKMEDFPANGPYKLDRNGAKVFEIIPGCEILSYKSKENVGSWEPITGITIEDDCDAVTCGIGGREVGVSTNESLAVFDNITGGLCRIAPATMTSDTLVPVFTHRPLLPELISDKQALQWLSYNENLGADIIPLTKDEAKAVATQLPSLADVKYALRAILETIKYDRALEALRARVSNRGVVWAKPKVITSLGKQRVYDFLVESTKVFVVNDGVVVYDTVNWVPLFSKEANANAISHIHSLSNYVSPKGDLLVSFDDLISMTWYNLMSDPIV